MMLCSFICTDQSVSYPVVATTDAKTSRVLLIIVIALHAGLAIAIKILFFAHGSPAASSPVTPSVPEIPKEGVETSRMLFGM